MNAFPYIDLLERVRTALPPGVSIYLVGGAVRDALLGRPVHDLDFVVAGDGLRISRQVADLLGAAFYALDAERDTGRVIWSAPERGKFVLDFATQRGPDLESDLRGRDFTLNAIAIDPENPQALIDPLKGAADLRAGVLRACSATAFIDDPLRVLRAARLAVAFKLHIEAETRRWMITAVQGLAQVSPERTRDEFFRMLDGPHPAVALRVLDRIGALEWVCPELAQLKGVAQSPPHILDAWNHTLDVIQKLETVIDALSPVYNEESSANLALGLMTLRLGRYREQIGARLASGYSSGRSLRSLLFLAALYHDIGKGQTRSVDEQGRTRFFDHEKVGAEIALGRARALRLSSAECEWLKSVILHHMRPLQLAQTGGLPGRRAIYRFFRDCAEKGVDICLLSLADVLGTYGAALPQETWAQHLEILRALMEAWWESPGEQVTPPALLDGNEIMDTFHLAPGPQVGQLLEAIREAQVTGQVRQRDEALAFARRWIAEGDPDQG